MPVYDYKAFNSRGKTVSGIIDASGTESARIRLKSRGLYVQNISEARRGRRSLFSLSGRRLTTAQLTRQLGFLLGAQIPVVSALDGIIDQISDEGAKRMMADIREKIKEGQSVSRAFGSYPAYFSRMYVNTLHAGEVSGNLDTAFQRLADMYDRNRALAARLRSALTYPVVLLFFSLVVIVFLVSFIVPTFAGLFEEFGQALPLPTRVLMGVSGFFTSWWWALLLVAGAAFLILRRAYRSDRGRRSFDRLVLKLPLVKDLLIDTFRVRFCRTMSLLLGSGIGVIESLNNTAGIFGNTVFSGLIQDSAERVKKGEKLSRALSLSDPGHTVFTPSILGMVRAGESGDTVPAVLDRVGENIEVELTERVGVLTSLAEPVLILVIGAVVAFAVLSIVLPIFQFNQFLG